MRTVILSILCLTTAFASPACKRAEKKSDTQSDTKSQNAGASRPAVRSKDVLATIQLPTGAKVETLAKAIDNIVPGASQGMLVAVPAVVGQGTGDGLVGCRSQCSYFCFCGQS